MGFLSGLFNRTPTTILAKWEGDKYMYYLMNKYLSANSVEKYTNENAYFIAETLPEVFIPIDLISDKVGGLPFLIVDKKTGEPVENLPTNLQRLLKKPNPFQSLSDLVYQIQFSQLASGVSYNYAAIPDSNSNKTEYISSIYNIKPYNICTNFKRYLPTNTFFIKSFSEVVDNFKVNHFTDVQLPADALQVNVTSSFDFNCFEILSPLSACSKNINNLLAVYQARYNAYVKNGAAGILSRKSAQDGDMAQFDTDNALRQKILDEMNSTDGINKNKNFIGISSIPMEFIKTIGTISELQPFDETKIDMLTIGGVFGINQHLLPIGDGTTFSNLNDAERFLWQNIIKPYAESMCDLLDELFLLNGTNFEFGIDFGKIEILQEDRLTSLQADALELDLYERLVAMGINNKEMLKKWTN